MINSEFSITDKIDQNHFFDLLQKNHYNLKMLQDLFDNNQASSIDRLQFNETIQRINREAGFKIFDMILYLEKYFTDQKKILELLEPKTKSMLEEESQRTYHRVNELGWDKLK